MLVRPRRRRRGHDRPGSRRWPGVRPVRGARRREHGADERAVSTPLTGRALAARGPVCWSARAVIAVLGPGARPAGDDDRGHPHLLRRAVLPGSAVPAACGRLPLAGLALALGGRRAGRLPAGPPAAAGAGLREPVVGLARATRSAAGRPDVHRLLPGVRLARLPVRRHGARSARPHRPAPGGAARGRWRGHGRRGLDDVVGAARPGRRPRDAEPHLHRSRSAPAAWRTAWSTGPTAPPRPAAGGGWPCTPRTRGHRSTCCRPAAARWR